MSRLLTQTEYWDKTPRNHKQFTFIRVFDSGCCWLIQIIPLFRTVCCPIFFPIVERRNFGFLLLCLVAVLAPLGLYINAKQQHWCTNFKLIFILIPILPNITKLIMTSWLSEKCEMVGRQFGSIVDCNLSFNNCSYISYLLDDASK